MAVSLSKGVYIVAGKRTPFGKLGGMYRETPAEDMFAAAARAALKAGGVAPGNVDTVNIGQISSISKTGMSARHASLKAGLPGSTPVLALNKLSGSALQAIIVSAQEILLGSAKISLAGGMESLSDVLYVVRNARFGVPLGTNLVLEDWLNNGNYDTYCKLHLVKMGDNLAVKYGLTRTEVDEMALRSQKKWKAAHDAGIFNTELAPVPVKLKGCKVTVTMDEFPRPDTTLEELSRLRPVYSGGVTTAGNVCGINDGAGALILASEEALTQHNLSPLARVVCCSCVGVEPASAMMAAVPAVRSILDVAGLRMEDIDLFEIHEVYASQILACAKELTVDWSKLNTNGGAIAIGHPSGATGARLTAHLVHELRRRKLKRGIACASISGGQGVGLLIETV